MGFGGKDGNCLDPHKSSMGTSTITAKIFHQDTGMM